MACRRACACLGEVSRGGPQVGADAPWIQAGEIEIEETAAAARAEAADAEETDVSDVGWT
eukprot:936574-Rhodomonas_salina.2